jgi:hypothetical protein
VCRHARSALPASDPDRLSIRNKHFVEGAPPRGHSQSRLVGPLTNCTARGGAYGSIQPGFDRDDVAPDDCSRNAKHHPPTRYQTIKTGRADRNKGPSCVVATTALSDCDGRSARLRYREVRFGGGSLRAHLDTIVQWLANHEHAGGRDHTTRIQQRLADRAMVGIMFRTRYRMGLFVRSFNSGRFMFTATMRAFVAR